MVSAALLCFYILPASADSVTLNSQNVAAFTDNGGGTLPTTEMSPYAGTFDGQAEEFFCVDYSTGISLGESWNVNVTALTGSSDYSNTLQGNETTYLEFAWLIEQLTDNLDAPTPNYTVAAQDEWAIWSFTGGPDPYGTNAGLILDAQDAVAGGFTASNFLILTPTPEGSGQEFMIIGTPEPSTPMLLGCGLLALLGAAWLRDRSNPASS